MIFKVITWFLCFEVFLWYLTVLSQWEWKPGRVSAATLWISCSRRTSLLICSSDGWLSLTSGSFMSLYQSARLIVSIYLLITERHIAIQARWFVLMRAGVRVSAVHTEFNNSVVSHWRLLNMTEAKHRSHFIITAQSTEIHSRSNKYTTHEDLIHASMLKGSIIPVVLLWFYHIIYSEAEDMQLKTCVYF